MPFSWYDSHTPEWFRQEYKSKGETQVENRIKTQARILRNMGFEQEEALKRVRLYLAWEWELPRSADTPCWDKVDVLVRQTYEMEVKNIEQGFPEPRKVHKHIREVYMGRALDAGAC